MYNFLVIDVLKLNISDGIVLRIATKPYRWLVNIGSGNGLVPSDTKPLPELILTKI